MHELLIERAVGDSCAHTTATRAPRFVWHRAKPFARTVMLIIYATALGCLATSTIASVTMEGDSTILVTGEIKPGDAAAFDRHLRQVVNSRKRLEFVDLNSPGGSIDEAILLGRLVRESRAFVIVGPGSKCFSSCVLILAGGAHRAVKGGTVGIHRPFFRDSPKESVASELSRVEARAKRYVNEMGVPEALVEAMFSISPSEVQILSEADLSRYRLNKTDPTVEEEQDLVAMKRYRLDRLEFNRRKSLLDSLCAYAQGNVDEMGKCVEDVMQTGTSQRSSPARKVASDLVDFFESSVGSYRFSRSSLRRVNSTQVTVSMSVALRRTIPVNGMEASYNQTKYLIDCRSTKAWAIEVLWRAADNRIIGRTNKSPAEAPAAKVTSGGYVEALIRSACE